MRVKVQIAGVSSLDEALALVRMGVDALGFTLRLPGGVHDGLTEAKARSIVHALPPFVASVAITYVETARDAMDLCQFTGVNTIQLHGEFPTGELEMLRAAMPYLKVIRAVHVTGPEAIAHARSLERRADALILDTFDPATGQRGATGRTHDWTISRQIVDAVRVPILLAGGLTPQNVGAAISTVRPWAVDVHTGIEDPDGRRNLDRMRAFVDAVRRVEAEPAPVENVNR